MEQRNSRLILSVSLLLYVTVLGFAAAFLWRGHAAAVERAEIQAATAAKAVASHAQWLLEAGGQALLRIDDILATFDASALERVVTDLPTGFELAIFDREARQVFPVAPASLLSEVDVHALFGGLADSSLAISHFLPEAAGGEGGFLVARKIFGR